MMKTRCLGRSQLMLSPLGLGTWALGGSGWESAWGPQDDHEAIAAIRYAVECGMNWIDTAPAYGLGHAEEIVGEALRDLDSSRRPYVFTKCTIVWDEAGRLRHTLEPASIRREIEQSLRRLQTDVVDLYQIHWPALGPGEPSGSIEAALETLVALRHEGKIREIGVSNFNVEQMQRAQAVAPIISVQPPYSILVREIERDLLPYCEAHSIGVIVYSPLQSGLLSGSMTRERVEALPPDDWRKTQSPDFQEPRLSRNLDLVDLLQNIGARHGRSAAEVALAWTLRKPAVTGAIVGARRPMQIDGLVGAAEFRLTEAEIAEITAKTPEATDRPTLEK